MSKRIFDIGDPEPEDVTIVVEVYELGHLIRFEDEGGSYSTWSRTNNDSGWKGYKGGKEYRDWPDLVRRFGPVMEWTP